MDRVQCSRDLELAQQLQQEEDRKRRSEESRQEMEEFRKLQVQRLITIMLFRFGRVLIFQICYQDFSLGVPVLVQQKAV